MTDPTQPVGDAPPPAASPRDAAGIGPGVLPLASVIAKPKSPGSRSTSLLLLLAGAIAVGGLAFAGGRLTAPAAATSSRTANGQRFTGTGQGFTGTGQAFPGRDGFGGISLTGTVDAVSADSITLKLASGTSITIPLDAKTAYHKAAAAAAGDVTVGSQVRVTPGARTANPDASFVPNASAAPGAGGISGIGFGAATDVTLVQP